jgi:hypothetical protein
MQVQRVGGNVAQNWSINLYRAGWVFEFWRLLYVKGEYNLQRKR